MQYLIKVVSELSVEELIALKVNMVHTIRPATSSHVLPDQRFVCMYHCVSSLSGSSIVQELENLVFPYRVSCPDPFLRGVWALGPNM